VLYKCSLHMPGVCNIAELRKGLQSIAKMLECGGKGSPQGVGGTFPTSPDLAGPSHSSSASATAASGGEFFIDNLLVRVHFTIVMIRWTGLAPGEVEFPFPGSLASTFLVICGAFALLFRLRNSWARVWLWGLSSYTSILGDI